MLQVPVDNSVISKPVKLVLRVRGDPELDSPIEAGILDLDVGIPGRLLFQYQVAHGPRSGEDQSNGIRAQGLMRHHREVKLVIRAQLEVVVREPPRKPPGWRAEQVPHVGTMIVIIVSMNDKTRGHSETK